VVALSACRPDYISATAFTVHFTADDFMIGPQLKRYKYMGCNKIIVAELLRAKQKTNGYLLSSCVLSIAWKRFVVAPVS
jgi:hypothetical protein